MSVPFNEVAKDFTPELKERVAKRAKVLIKEETKRKKRLAKITKYIRKDVYLLAQTITKLYDDKEWLKSLTSEDLGELDAFFSEIEPFMQAIKKEEPFRTLRRHIDEA
jgi:hypothetical protein